jgi:L-fuconolactonase
VSVVVDSHHHLWRLDQQDGPWLAPGHEAIAHDYTPADLEQELRRSGVDATVLVQAAESTDENDRVRDWSSSIPFVAGLVGWLPLADPPAARDELARIRGPHLRGVRCLVGREPIERFEQRDSIALLSTLADEGLAWDIVVATPAQAESVIRIAQAVPALRVIVDHLARPPLETGAMEPWATYVRGLADCPNVALKLSVGIDVLPSWRAWAADELVPYVDRAAECFGPSRLMLASNWPVVLLRRSYEGAWSDVLAAARRAGIDGAELDEVLGGTAVRWYGLDVAAPPRA